jgi:adenylate kinase
MVIRNVIVILGPPGSGKGTQGKFLAQVLGYNYLSMGQYLREYSMRDTELAGKVQETIDSGRIIPDTWMTDIFGEAVENLPDAPGVILDGFPRDVGQAPILAEFLNKHNTQSLKVIFMEVSEDKLMQRLLNREGVESRADDEPSVIHTRFLEYENKTYPLKKYFEDKNVLVMINGDQSVHDVHAEIMKKLKA